MNSTAAGIGMTKSHFAVSHGMHNYENYSSALDIALLTRIALKSHPLLEQIVNTKQYCV
jgi:serine-type D-Ala-D-Ala carboxypeptidase (penicillin-binding protein 5/6)